MKIEYDFAKYCKVYNLKGTPIGGVKLMKKAYFYVSRKIGIQDLNFYLDETVCLMNLTN